MSSGATVSFNRCNNNAGPWTGGTAVVGTADAYKITALGTCTDTGTTIFTGGPYFTWMLTTAGASLSYTATHAGYVVNGDGGTHNGILQAYGTAPYGTTWAEPDHWIDGNNPNAGAIWTCVAGN